MARVIISVSSNAHTQLIDWPIRAFIRAQLVASESECEQ